MTSGRGSVFRLCELSRTDPAFPRYPPLPVVRCPGFNPTIDPGDRDDILQPDPEK